MKLSHYYVNLVDLPEVLPFAITADSIENDTEAQEESSKALFEFVEALEQFDNVHYIGQDNIEGKFYQRFLFEGGGFIEVMQKAPSAIIAHFSDGERAQQFADVLKDCVQETATEERAGELLAGDISVFEEEEGSLSYNQWSKLKNVREAIGG